MGKWGMASPCSPSAFIKRGTSPTLSMPNGNEDCQTTMCCHRLPWNGWCRAVCVAVLVILNSRLHSRGERFRTRNPCYRCAASDHSRPPRQCYVDGCGVGPGHGASPPKECRQLRIQSRILDAMLRALCRYSLTTGYPLGTANPERRSSAGYLYYTHNG